MCKNELQLEASQPACIRDYLSMARLDHSTKHIFIIPGVILAYMLRGIQTDHFDLSLILGFTTAVCIASANYVINEWLDREFDKHHPAKSQRSAVQSAVSGTVVIAEWTLLVTMGFICAAMSSRLMLGIAILFALQGIIYNVAPIRSKDLPYLDVISESVNNPIRLLIGWSIVDPESLPPGSIILSYWCGGAFLMAAKRLSEYREIVASHGIALLTRYRASFTRYTEVSLTASCTAYSLFSVFFLTVFLIKYRVEFILAVPVVVALFTTYFVMSTSPGSSAQKPEKLFRESGLILIVVVLVAVFIFASLVDLPILSSIAGQHYITFK